MKKKILSVLMAAGFMLGVVGIASATPPADEDGHRPNDHGLCTAYFNGQKNGWDKAGHTAPGPFLTLEQTANAYTDSDGDDNNRKNGADEPDEHKDLSQAENIYNYCSDMSEIGGNVEHGRFTCSDGDPEGDSDPNCTNNEGPGNS